MLAKGLWLAAEHLPCAAMGEGILVPMGNMLIASVWINLVLCIFNFLPIPPLDGSRILTGLLHNKLAAQYVRFWRYGCIVMLALAFTGVVSKVIMPMQIFARNLLLS